MDGKFSFHLNSSRWMRKSSVARRLQPDSSRNFRASASLNPWRLPGRSVRHDVEDLARDEDDLADGLALEVFVHLAAGESGGFSGFLVGVLGDHETVTELAVHLDDELDLVADKRFGIVNRPG